MDLDQTKDIQKLQMAKLVKDAQGGDREAFEQLFLRYQRVVYAAVFQRLGNHAEAQEVCQEVLIQAMRKIGQLKNPLCFGAWLRAIAGRMAINRAVRRGPFVAAEPEQFEARCVENQTPLGRMLAREREDQLRLGLKRLPDLDRNTLEAFYFRGQSLVEMSDEFQSPVGTIKRRLHVARKRLAKELQGLAPA
ncbi:MAG: sigma-70 family RNA polymerase sigma factor [Rhodopirellula sp.]|nr:sigma-70 family RNA polymerase sigma factor [Rhodopirellula sp.]